MMFTRKNLMLSFENSTAVFQRISFCRIHGRAPLLMIILYVFLVIDLMKNIIEVVNFFQILLNLNHQ